MPGYLPVGYRDRDDLPHVVAPVRQHSCVDCGRGPRCDGLCSRRVCKLHAYQCSREGCDGPMCETCWTRHEVRGIHSHASPSEVADAQRPRRGYPMPHKLHVRTGRYPGATPARSTHPRTPEA